MKNMKYLIIINELFFFESFLKPKSQKKILFLENNYLSENTNSFSQKLSFCVPKQKCVRFEQKFPFSVVCCKNNGKMDFGFSVSKKTKTKKAKCVFFRCECPKNWGNRFAAKTLRKGFQTFFCVFAKVHIEKGTLRNQWFNWNWKNSKIPQKE